MVESKHHIEESKELSRVGRKHLQSICGLAFFVRARSARLRLKSRHLHFDLLSANSLRANHPTWAPEAYIETTCKHDRQ